MRSRNSTTNVVYVKWGRLLGIDDAAAYLGISGKTIRNGLTKNAERPFPVKPRRFGRRVLFNRKDLDAFADSLPVDS